jgi:hypothetical protein
MANAQREGEEMRSQDISLLVFGFGKHAGIKQAEFEFGSVKDRIGVDRVGIAFEPKTCISSIG